MNKYGTCTKDKDKLSYSLFIQKSLLELGFSPIAKGTKLFQELVVIAHYIDNEFVTMKQLCKILAEKYNTSQIVIYKNIEYAVSRIDTNKTKKNFKNILGVEYDYYYLMPKTLLVLLLNINNSENKIIKS